jgi:hypothetical protein
MCSLSVIVDVSAVVSFPCPRPIDVSSLVTTRQPSFAGRSHGANAPSLLLRRRPLTTLGRPLLPLSRSRSGVSRVR